MRTFSKLLLRLTGWKSIGEVIPEPKAIILGAPHTSLWDFFFSWFYYRALGGKAHILVKKKFFFWPACYILDFMGAIPVDNAKGASLVKQIISAFKSRDHLHLAIALEGTRKPTTKWKGGFHTIAKAANLPVYFGVFDWGRKELGIVEKFELTDDVNADLLRVKQWYKNRGVQGKHPERFIYGDGLDEK